MSNAHSIEAQASTAPQNTGLSLYPNKRDEKLVEASRRYKVTKQGEFERVSYPKRQGKGAGAPVSMGVKFDSNHGRYRCFNHKELHWDKSIRIYSHRMIFYLIHGYLPEVVDHIDGDGHNNHPSNLRGTTQSKNLQNSKSRSGSSSIYKGVGWDKERGLWIASIRVSSVQYHLGRFKSEKQAAQAYNEAAKKHFGEFANLNEI